MIDEVRKQQERLQHVIAKIKEMRRNGMRAVDGGGEKPEAAPRPVLRLVKTAKEES